MGTVEVDRCVKCWAHKHEAMNAGPQHSHTKLCTREPEGL